MIAWDLYDLCLISAELEKLESQLMETEVKEKICGYETSLGELFQLTGIDQFISSEHLTEDH